MSRRRDKANAMIGAVITEAIAEALYQSAISYVLDGIDLAPPSEWKKDRYQWDEDKARYRYPPKEDGKLGRLVPDRYVRNIFERNIAEVEKQVKALSERMTKNELSVRQWQHAMRDLQADAHLQATMLGVGGRAQMTRADYQRASDLWRSDARYMARFAQQIANGNAGTEAQIVARSAQYAGASLREDYNQARLQSELAIGCNEERWNLSGSSNSCDDCIALDGQGWVGIGELPEIGSNQCRSGCNCWVTRRRNEDLVAQ